MLAHFGPLLTFSTLRSAVVSMLLLTAVTWIAGCERGPAVEPTAVAPPTATAEAEPGETEEVARQTPVADTPSPSPTVVTPATPTPRAARIVIDGGPELPCGPGHWIYQYYPYNHSRFLHWANGTSTLIADVGQEVWRVDTGGAWVRKTADPNPGWRFAYGHYADVSPDGSRIAYATCEYTYYDHDNTDGRRNRGYEIATVNVDGTGRQRLTGNGSFENYPVWSPDGGRIAFIANYDLESDSDSGSSHYEPSETQIFTMAADGTDVKVVPNTEGVGLYPPVWSPNGERLAFTVHGGWDEVARRDRRILYTIRVDGSDLSRIGEASTLPTWSPDGERLAFGFADYIDDGGVYSGVNVVQFNGTGARRIVNELVRPAHQVFQVSWSPDGSELLIASDLLLTVRPDGTDLRAFSQLGLGLIHDATWSPDGSWIAVRQSATRDRYDWAYVVSVMTRNGTDVTIVAEGDSDQGSDPFIRQYTPPLPSAACSAGVVVPEPGANPGLVQDCETLVGAVGRLVELPAWEALGWNADTPIAEWSRVTVGGDPPRIRELMLEDSGLTGMPGELRKLQMLEVLDLSANELNGAIPPELGRLAMLKTLALAINYLTGPIPPELGKLAMLKELGLHDNKLTGPIPPELDKLTMLEELALSDNNLTGPIPPELGELIMLKILHLSRNNLTGPIPPELSKLTMLERLSLHHNDLSGCVPSELPDIWVGESRLKRCEP